MRKRKTTNKKKRKTKNDDFLRLHESPEDDYGAVQVKKNEKAAEDNFDDDDDDTTVIASDSELDDALNKEEEEMKKEGDDDNKTEEDSEIQSTKTKTISTRELIVKRKENVEALMRVYEQTYYDLIETMRKRHRKFQLKHGHVGLKSAATALANARGLKAGKDDGENTIVEGEQQQHQHEGGDHEREQNGTRTTCSSETCEKNAMPFSRFCFEHVSLDAKQRFYEVIDGKLEWRVRKVYDERAKNRRRLLRTMMMAAARTKLREKASTRKRKTTTRFQSRRRIQNLSKKCRRVRRAEVSIQTRARRRVVQICP